MPKRDNRTTNLVDMDLPFQVILLHLRSLTTHLVNNHLLKLLRNLSHRILRLLVNLKPNLSLEACPRRRMITHPIMVQTSVLHTTIMVVRSVNRTLLANKKQLLLNEMEVLSGLDQLRMHSPEAKVRYVFIVLHKTQLLGVCRVESKFF
jgi:hypothetical protein